MPAHRCLIVADGRKQAFGTLTCKVRITDATGRWSPDEYVISCLHVLALAQEYYPDFAPGASVRTSGGQVEVAQATRHQGFILDRFYHCFDGAIAKVVNPGLIRDLLPALPPTRPALTEAGLPSSAVILVPEDMPIRAADPKRYAGDQLTIPYEAGSSLARISVWHRRIIRWICGGNVSTRGGDSGSPVVSPDGTTLLGMHIAGGGGFAYMIPAADLLNPAHYYGLSNSGRIELT